MRRACILFAGMMTACASSTEKTYEGVYIFSSEAEIFAPCGSGGRAWWVIASEPVWLELRDTTLRLTSEPTKPAFAGRALGSKSSWGRGGGAATAGSEVLVCGLVAHYYFARSLNPTATMSIFQAA